MKALSMLLKTSQIIAQDVHQYFSISFRSFPSLDFRKTKVKDLNKKVGKQGKTLAIDPPKTLKLVNY